MDINKGAGKIIKCVGGSYTVETPGGLIVCKARGIFRKDKITPVAGDNVEVTFDDSGEPIISKVLPRKNLLIRPPAANIDLVLFVVSACHPSPNFLILDKLIAVSEYIGIEQIIVITKTDLSDYSKFMDVYVNSGFVVYVVDNGSRMGTSEVADIIKGKTSIFMGNSGVGKTSLLNNIIPGIDLKTAGISKKLGRGKHTTREVNLHKLECGGYLADTPGFSTIEIQKYHHISKEQLSYCFKEFLPYIGKCKYAKCAHIKEQNCAVLSALEDGKIQKSRHDSYVKMYEETSRLNLWDLPDVSVKNRT